jgi:hypothetical protein
MDKERTVERIIEWRSIAVRRICRPKLKWEGDARDDMGRLKIHNWSKMAVDREAWKGTVEYDRTHEE